MRKNRFKSWIGRFLNSADARVTAVERWLRKPSKLKFLLGVFLGSATLVVTLAIILAQLSMKSRIIEPDYTDFGASFMVTMCFALMLCSLGVYISMKNRPRYWKKPHKHKSTPPNTNAH